MQFFATQHGVVRRTKTVERERWEIIDADPDGLETALRANDLAGLGSSDALADVDPKFLDFRPPLTPGRVIIVGLNYRSHAEEVGVTAPESLLFVPASPSAPLGGPGTPIVLPQSHPDQVDYEAEIAVIIGHDTTTVSVTDAWEVIAGITAANDLTARDLQMARFADGDFTSAKMLPGFKPLGPGVITVADARQGLQVSSFVNGVRRQHASDADMVFDIPHIVSTIAAQLGLRAGDVILTGSPAGVGTVTGRLPRGWRRRRGVCRRPTTVAQPGDERVVSDPAPSPSSIRPHTPPCCSTLRWLRGPMC